MTETIEKVQADNKRLLCVLAARGWVIDVKHNYISANAPDWSAALIIFRNWGRKQKHYWLNTHGHIRCFQHEESVLAQFGYRPLAKKGNRA